MLLGATGGTARHSLAIDHSLRPLFAYLGALVNPTAVYAATEDWGAGDTGDGIVSRVERAGSEFAELITGRPATSAPTGLSAPASFAALLKDS